MNLKSLLLAAALASTSCLIVGDAEHEVRMATFKRSAELQGEQRMDVDLRMSVGSMHVQPIDSNQSYELDLRYNEASFRPELDYREGGQDSGAALRFKLEGHGRGKGDNELDLGLNRTLVYDLRADTGVGKSVIDLSGLKAESLVLQSGVGEMELAILSPNPISCRRVDLQSGVGGFEAKGLGNLSFRELKFSGGVGGAHLDFSGEWREVGKVSIEVGVGGVDIVLPREIGAEVKASKSFLSGVNLTDFTKSSGNIYRSRNYDDVEKKVRFSIQAGIGGINVRWK